MTPEQLDWLAEQAGWVKNESPNCKWQRVFPEKGEAHYFYDGNPYTATGGLDRLIVDHDGWMIEHGFRYNLCRGPRLIDPNGEWYWSVDMWRVRPAEDWDFDAATPEAALAEAFFTARGGPQ